MKTVLKIASVFMLLLYSVNAYSQNHVPQAGDTIPNPNFDKYVGTWKWEGNGKSFTIIFKKIYGQYPINVNVSGDMLIRRILSFMCFYYLHIFFSKINRKDRACVLKCKNNWRCN
ncbi:DUF6705 family protein [Chryseobacterium zhengzhouense]|uniref:DUF6705 family protein n=1 Tax=Chryseobacterium zhengzhouense TaxID=1636086 RepID=A0ABW2M388_9FLAO